MTLFCHWRGGPRALALATVLATLAACGGGGSGGASPQANTDADSSPTPNAGIAAPASLAATASPKQMALQWTPVPGAASYELWQDADGPDGPQPSRRVASGLATPGAVTPTALDVHATPWVTMTARACTEAGCSADSPAATIETASLAGVFKAQRPQDELGVGQSVALSRDGSVLVVGAPGRTVGNSDAAGSVIVHTRTAAGWQVAEIPSPAPFGGGNFGWRVAVSADGSRIAAAALNTLATAGATDAGTVYILQRQGETWAKVEELPPPDPLATWKFGSILALSADGGTLMAGSSSMLLGTSVLVVASLGESGQLAVEPLELLSLGTPPAKAALSADGRHVVAAVMNPDDNSWSLVGFDRRVENGPPGPPWSTSRLFTPEFRVWTFTQSDFNGEVIGGLALSADGSRLAVGLPGVDGAAVGTEDAGGFVVLQRDGDAWRPLGSQGGVIFSPRPQGSARLGTSIALSDDGTVVAVGAQGDRTEGRLGDGRLTAPEHGTASGAIEVFRVGDTQADPLAYLKAPRGTTTSAVGGTGFITGFMGYLSNIALSGDGRSLAVGDPEQSAGAPGVTTPPMVENAGGPTAGAVYLY